MQHARKKKKKKICDTLVGMGSDTEWFGPGDTEARDTIIIQTQVSKWGQGCSEDHASQSHGCYFAVGGGEGSARQQPSDHAIT